jgi:hypothetical protein
MPNSHVPPSDRHVPTVGIVRAFRQSRKHRQERQRLHDDEQDDEEFDQFVEHHGSERFAT